MSLSQNQYINYFRQKIQATELSRIQIRKNISAVVILFLCKTCFLLRPLSSVIENCFKKTKSWAEVSISQTRRHRPLSSSWLRSLNLYYYEYKKIPRQRIQDQIVFYAYAV